MMVQTKGAHRKRQFGAALKLAGMTVNEWVARQNVTRQHLDYVLRDERKPSAELDEAISSFIAKHLPESAA